MDCKDASQKIMRPPSYKNVISAFVETNEIKYFEVINIDTTSIKVTFYLLCLRYETSSRL